MTSAGAVKANATRREVAAADVLYARFDSRHKDLVRGAASEFLRQHVRPGGVVGDLLGGGRSAEQFHRVGLQVLAVDDLSWSSAQVGGRVLAERAATRLAKRIGVELYIGSFLDVVPRLAGAFFDPCGPYREKSSGRVVRAMADARLDAFVVTAMLSRVDGLRGEGEAAYLRFTRAGLSEDAPQFAIDRELPYRGEAGVPMAAFFLRNRVPRRFASLRERPDMQPEGRYPTTEDRDCALCYRFFVARLHSQADKFARYERFCTRECKDAYQQFIREGVVKYQ